MIKTSTDLLLEKYFEQETIRFTPEPYNSKQANHRNPDYLIYKAGRKILIENKEIVSFFLDKATKYVQTHDPHIYFDVLRRRIDSASAQLKPYQNDVDHCIILLGKKAGFPLKLNDVFYAMYGDPVIRIPIRVKEGTSVEKPYFDMKTLGALRKNKPESKEMIAVHDYISGVGLIKSFNGQDYYQSIVMEKEMEQYSYEHNKNIPLDQILDKYLENYERIWSKLKKKIPEQYKDANKIFYKIELIANPLSKKVISGDIFNNEWDIVQFPKVITKV
jgi:hypothetical protein